MFIPRLYYPHPLTLDQTVSLDKTTSHYLSTVLRLKNNEPVILFNGEKGEYTGNFLAHAKQAHVLITNFTAVDRESPLFLHLGQGLARGDRMDWVMQKATELGINAITPLLTAHCAVKLKGDRIEQRMSHWQNIVISAAEQCGRTQLPVIHPPMSLNEWVQENFEGLSLLCEPNSEQTLRQIDKTNRIRLAIGPESGWDQKELDSMFSTGFIGCRLGPRVMRTETAAIAALSVLQSAWGDL